MLLTSLMLACSGGCNGGASDRDTADSGKADTGAANADTACEPGAYDTAFVDACAGIVGAGAGLRQLVTAGDARALFPTFPVREVIVLRSQAELDAFWAASLLPADSKPAVDFATEQGVAYAGDTVNCHAHEAMAGVFEATAEPGRLVAAIDVHDTCSGCDTGAVWAFELWATPIAEVSACEVGVQCQVCAG